MKLAKMIYAVILAGIYMAAMLASSLSVLTCTHPHHTHIAEAHAHCSCADCHTHGDASHTLNAECCDHEHALLGDTETQFIVEKQRGDDAMPLLYALDISLAVAAEGTSLNHLLPTRVEPYRGDEQLPLSAAFVRYDALRAPPTLA